MLYSECRGSASASASISGDSTLAHASLVARGLAVVACVAWFDESCFAGEGSDPGRGAEFVEDATDVVSTVASAEARRIGVGRTLFPHRQPPTKETPQLQGFRSLRVPSAVAVSVTWRASWLRPELVPGVEIGEVLPTVDAPAVLELEDDAAVNIQALAGSRPAVVMHGDHAALVICEHVPQLGPEGSVRSLPIAAELGKDCLAALVVAGEGASPRRVPRGALVEGLSERLHVGGVEGLVRASDECGVRVLRDRGDHRSSLVA